MARTLNLVLIEGNLGRDPEMRYTTNGTAVTQLSVATARPYKDAQDQWAEETTWFRVTCWGQLAERVAENGRKGRFARVQGRIRTWEQEVVGCPKGKHYGFEVIADRVDWLDKADDVAGGGHPGDDYVDGLAESRGRMPAVSPLRETTDLDDLPF